MLDVMMPGLDGVSVVKRLRGDGIDIPVCMLSARDEVEDRVAGLQAGADDYLVKPFAIAELTARLEALLRRRGAEGAGPHMAGDVVVDPRRHIATRAGRELGLTRREFDLLDVFVRHPGQVLCARPAAVARVGLHDRRRDERRRRLRRLPAAQARERGRAADPPHRARRRLGAAAVRAPRSLRARIALAAVGAVALCGVLAGALLLAAVERDGRNQLDGELRERALSILRRPPDRDAYGHDRGAQSLLKGSGTFAQVAYDNGVSRRRATCRTMPPDVPEDDGFETVEIDGTPWRSLTTRSPWPAARGCRC